MCFFGTPVIVTNLAITGSTANGKRAARLVLLGVSTAAASLGRRAIYLGLAARRVALDTSAGAHARAVIIH